MSATDTLSTNWISATIFPCKWMRKHAHCAEVTYRFRTFSNARSHRLQSTLLYFSKFWKKLVNVSFTASLLFASTSRTLFKIWSENKVTRHFYFQEKNCNTKVMMLLTHFSVFPPSFDNTFIYFVTKSKTSKSKQTLNWPHAPWNMKWTHELICAHEGPRHRLGWPRVTNSHRLLRRIE